MQEMLTLIFIGLCCIIIVLYLLGFVGSGPVTSKREPKYDSTREPKYGSTREPKYVYDNAELTQRVNRRMRDNIY
jgi:hypothetical protein